MDILPLPLPFFSCVSFIPLLWTSTEHLLCACPLWPLTSSSSFPIPLFTGFRIS